MNAVIPQLEAEELTSVHQQDLLAINALLKTMHKKGPPPEMTQTTWVLFRKAGGVAFVIREPGSGIIVAMVTVVLVVKINSIGSRVEHFGISEPYKGKYLGQTMMQAITGYAKQMGLAQMTLTTQADMEATLNG